MGIGAANGGITRHEGCRVAGECAQRDRAAELRRGPRCLDQQREFYSEHTISEVEKALTRVMGQLDRLCAHADADKVVSRLLQQFDTVTRLSAWSDPRQIH